MLEESGTAGGAGRGVGLGVLCGVVRLYRRPHVNVITHGADCGAGTNVDVLVGVFIASYSWRYLGTRLGHPHVGDLPLSWVCPAFECEILY